MQMPKWMKSILSDGFVPRSKIGRESEAELEQLTALGFLVEEIYRGGKRIKVCNRDDFAQWVAKSYPNIVPPTSSGLIRAENITRTSRSKSGRSSHPVLPFFLRWFSPDPQHPLHKLTYRYGVFGITTDHVESLEPPETWTLLTVENYESFLATNYTPQDSTILVVYVEGNIPGVLLYALNTIQPPPMQVVHFGDYDWSGVAIFRRIQEIIPKAKLYIPENIGFLFDNYANYEIIVNQTPLASRLSDDFSTRRIIDLIAQYNSGLEQEIVEPPSLEVLLAM